MSRLASGGKAAQWQHTDGLPLEEEHLQGGAQQAAEAELAQLGRGPGFVGSGKATRFEPPDGITQVKAKEEEAAAPVQSMDNVPCPAPSLAAAPAAAKPPKNKGATHMAGASHSSRRLWEVVSADGVTVRREAALTSTQERLKLASGALVEEVELRGTRLRYRRASVDVGPAEGWISLRAAHKDLVVRTSKNTNSLFLYDSWNLGLHTMRDWAQVLLECQKGRLCWQHCAANHDTSAVVIMRSGGALGPALVASEALPMEAGRRLEQHVILACETLQPCHRLAVTGMEEHAVQSCCDAALALHGPEDHCQITVCRSPSSFDVVGSKGAIESLASLCRGEASCQERGLVPPFHTSPSVLPESFLLELRAAVEAELPEMQSPRHTIWADTCSRPLRPGCPPEEVSEALKKCLVEPCRWWQTVQFAIRREHIGEVLALGPETPTSRHLKTFAPQAWKSCRAIEVPQDAGTGAQAAAGAGLGTGVHASVAR